MTDILYGCQCWLCAGDAPDYDDTDDWEDEWEDDDDECE